MMIWMHALIFWFALVPTYYPIWGCMWSLTPGWNSQECGQSSSPFLVLCPWARDLTSMYLHFIHLQNGIIYTLLSLTHGWKILCLTIINYNYHFLCICHESCRASSATMINLKTGICSSTTDRLANNSSITQIPCLLMWDSNSEKH